MQPLKTKTRRVSTACWLCAPAGFPSLHKWILLRQQAVKDLFEGRKGLGADQRLPVDHEAGCALYANLARNIGL